MKTKELIEMLQKEDPTGECYVRIDGGAISHCEKKPGYYDGMYSYFENDVFHTSAKGDKVDIITISWKDIVWELDGDMEEIRKLISPDFSHYMSYEDEEKKFWEKIELESKKAKVAYEKLASEMLNSALKRFNDGWTFYTTKDNNCSYWGKYLIENGAMMGEIEQIHKNPNLFVKKEYLKKYKYKLKK